MKQITGEKAAELLYGWYSANAAALHGDIRSITEMEKWLDVAADLAMSIAVNPHSNWVEWPEPARILLGAQIAGWMAVAVQKPYSNTPLPIDKDSMRSKSHVLTWLFREQIAPMSLFREVQ